MTNNRTPQQNLESSPPSAEPARMERIRIDDPLDVASSNITTTASYQQTGQLPHAESVAPSIHIQLIPSTEDALLVLKKRRLEGGQQSVYIPLMAKANLQAPDDELFLLMDKVQEFLASEREVMLVLGDSLAGKSTFNIHLEHYLWTNYTKGSPIPLFIHLPAIREPEEYMVEKQLRNHNFTEDQIREMKQHREFILICDGYDEAQLEINLHKTNRLNQQDQWYAKMVISCRSQFLVPVYLNRFTPQPTDHKKSRLHLFQEAVIAPFSKQQIQDYVEQYVSLEPWTWTTQDYMDKLTIIPNLMDLVKNPFLLSLSLKALSKVTEGKLDLSTIKITRVQLYDIFVEHWLDVNKQRLQGNVLSKEDRATLDDLVDAGFVTMGVDFSTKLASAIFEQQGGNLVIRYVHCNDKKSWKADFFGPGPEIRMLRESSPLTRTGSLFRFFHRSMLEYFLSRAVFDPSGHVDNQGFSPQLNSDCSVVQPLDPHGPLFTRNLLAEPSVIQFLCERVKQYPAFEKQLLAVIEQSKTDSTAATAATNAITILVRAGVRFNGADLRGIRIPGADLSDSQFDSAQLQDADLTGVNLARIWLRQADLIRAQMEGVRFGESPFIKEEGEVSVCAYSPDGRMLAVGGYAGGLSIYETKTWCKAYQRPVNGTRVTCVAFSPNNQQLVYGKQDSIVQLWDFASNDTVFNMVGHAESVKSVVFSPCGKQCASASEDKSVRLWSSETAECLFVLEGHTDTVDRVAYCTDGNRLVSGSANDGTIRVWDSETGEPVACWNIAHEFHSTIAFSADGKWVAVSLGSKVQIMNVITGEPGPVLNNSTRPTCISFSSNGQWIVTSSTDGTLRLWDISSELLISSFSGQTHKISSCTFSPSGFQIASGDVKGYVRLWEVNTSRAISGLDRPTGPVFTVTYSPDGLSILSGSDGQGVQQWDSRTGVPVLLPLKMADEVSSFSLSPNDNQIATGHYDGTIRLWDRQADTAERTLLGHTNRVTQLAYSSCGRWIVSVSWMESVGRSEAQLWDLHTNQHPGVIAQMDDSGALRVAFTPTGQIALNLGRDTIRLHDPRAQDPCTALKEVSMHFVILSLDCSPVGQEIAIGAEGGKVYLWDFQSDKPCIELEGHNASVCSVAYSPCGKWILSGSDDKTVRIWRFRTGDVSSWACVSVVDGCSNAILDLAWNPVGTTLEFATGCVDGSVRVWRIGNHDDDDGEDVSVQMLWGNDVGLFCASDLTFKDAIGLSPIYQKLLVQRGAKRGHLHQRKLIERRAQWIEKEEQEWSEEEAEWSRVDDE